MRITNILFILVILGESAFSANNVDLLRKIHCINELSSSSENNSYIDAEYSAVMCRSIKRDIEIPVLRKCYKTLEKRRSSRQSDYDYAILCSDAKTHAIVELRISCLKKAKAVIKSAWSPRDKYTLCGNINTTDEMNWSFNCYKEAKKSQRNLNSKELAILCSGN